VTLEILDQIPKLARKFVCYCPNERRIGVDQLMKDMEGNQEDITARERACREVRACVAWSLTDFRRTLFCTALLNFRAQQSQTAWQLALRLFLPIIGLVDLAQQPAGPRSSAMIPFDRPQRADIGHGSR
jgi:hypothetical protein